MMDGRGGSRRRRCPATVDSLVITSIVAMICQPSSDGILLRFQSPTSAHPSAPSRDIMRTSQIERTSPRVRQPTQA